MLQPKNIETLQIHKFPNTNVYNKNKNNEILEGAICLVPSVEENRILDFIEYEIVDDGINILNCNKALSGNCVIPELIDGYCVVNIADYAFENCDQIIQIKLPETIGSIGKNAFANCLKLSTFTIPYGVSVINDNLFNNCISLRDIHIPDTIVSIGKNVFESCISLMDIYYGDSQEHWANIVIDETNNILSNLTIHYNQALATKEFVLNNYDIDVMDIIQNYCKIWSGDVDYKENDQVIANIKDDKCNYLAFMICKQDHRSIPITDKLTIEDLEELSNYWEYIIIDSQRAMYAETALNDSEGNNIVETYATKEEIKNLPSGEGGGTVDQEYDPMSENAQSGVGLNQEFKNYYKTWKPDTTYTIGDCVVFTDFTETGFNSLILGKCKTEHKTPETWSEIYNNLLNSDDNWKDYLNDNWNYTYLISDKAKTDQNGNIFEETYATKEELNNISISGVIVDQNFDATSQHAQSGTAVAEAIAKKVDRNKVLDYIDYFIENEQTVTIEYVNETISGNYTIPEFIEGYPVTRIQSWAFRNCKNLTHITLPDSIVSIDEEAFLGCESLVSIILSNGLINIGMRAFDTCNNLTTIAIPNGVKRISTETFWNCTNLTNIAIPDSITEFGYGIFSNCTNLTNIYYSGTKAQWDSITVDENNEILNNVTIHYNQALATKEFVLNNAGPGGSLTVDQTYNPESKNAQSGAALAPELRYRLRVWESGVKYYEGDYVIHSDDTATYIYQCGAEHEADEFFPQYWNSDFAIKAYSSEEANKAYRDSNDKIIDEHYATKQELNNQIGDISTVLDNILAVQQTYVGGTE